MSERLLASLEARRPSLRNAIVEYKKLNDFELLIKLNDGVILLYDDYRGTFRYIPNEYEYGMTEDECRHEFGIRLRGLLERKGMTQRELAYRLNMGDSQLSQYISGKKTPSFYTVYKIVRELECSMDELMFSI